MKNNIPTGKSSDFYPSMATMHRWKLSALAAAALASVVLCPTDALALALGPVTVQSALGEPLRAEIELPRITPAEAESLKVTTAAPETFRAQGLEYSGAASQVRMVLQRRPDGRSVLVLSSNSPVNEPFVDLVIDATWATGRITRSYTMLFDPPALRRPAPTVTAAPQITARVPTPSVRPAPVASPRTPAPERVASAASAAADSVTVKSGDTAGRIANAHRPRSVSLDQMLVAMLRANPDAFIGGNINRVKAGAVLQLPDEALANATPATEARQTIAAQSRDFNEFRRKLAGAAPVAATAASGRSETGRVQTQVQEPKSASATPDKLTLSKGGVQGTKASPEALAERKQASEASARVEELSKNISELNKLASASAAPAAAAGQSQTGSGPAVTGTVPAATPPATPDAPPAAANAAPATPAPAVPGAATDTPAATDAASTAATAAEPTTDAATTSTDAAPAQTPTGEATPAPAAAVAPPPAAPPPAPAAPAEEPSFISKLIDEPLIPGGGLLLLALLGYGGYRVAQSRKSKAPVDSSFLESRLQPDSFFGASGGQRIDTANSDSSTGSSMAYSPSQLDAGGDVDPVAEADVYLAYGRDLQAEEILKEAIRHNPDRVSVHAKLSEIYAKRQDRKSLEAVAKDIFRITDGMGADWNRVCELGTELDPDNRFYQPGGQVTEAPELTAPSSFASTYSAADGPPSMPADLDLDLDLELRDDDLTEAPPVAPASGSFAAAAAAAAATSAAMEQTAVETTPLMATGAVSHADEPAWSPPTGSGLAWEPPQPIEAPAAEPTELAQFATTGMHDFPLDLPSADTEPQALQPEAEKPFVPQDSGLMDFDLGHLSLDLDAKPAEETGTVATPLDDAAGTDDPLATKLALADAFTAIDDNDGARTLIEEVIAEASGETKARAERMLRDLK